MRSRWAKLLYGVDCTDATQYDVIFSPEVLRVADAVAAIGELRR